MAEAARRFDQIGRPDIVRRLIARPIRLEHTRHIPEVVERALEPVVEPDATGEPEDRDLESLEAEIALLKAIVGAERRETASLRARLEAGGDGLRDGIATRDRWAALVDDLLLRLR